MEFTPQLNVPFVIDSRNAIHCSLLVAKMRNSVNEVIDTGPLSWQISSPQTSNFCSRLPYIYSMLQNSKRHLHGTSSHGHWEVLKAPRILGSILETNPGVWQSEKERVQSGPQGGTTTWHPHAFHHVIEIPGLTHTES